MKKFLVGILVLWSISAFSQTRPSYGRVTSFYQTINSDDQIDFTVNGCGRYEVPEIHSEGTTITARCKIKQCFINLGVNGLWGKSRPNKVYYIKHKEQVIIDEFPVYHDSQYNETLGLEVQDHSKNGKLAEKARSYIRKGHCTTVSWSWGNPYKPNSRSVTISLD